MESKDYIKRETGVDLFRILCCIGVLVYHVVDDVIFLPGCMSGRVIYYMASFCVPGFFLLAGYLLGTKKEVSSEYIEKKCFRVMAQYFGWILFWDVAYFFMTGEWYDLWENFVAGAMSQGVLPIAWFLFTYCFVIICGCILNKLSGRWPSVLVIISTLWLCGLAMGWGSELVYTKTQALWIHLYLGYFCMGMVLRSIQNKLDSMVSDKVQIVILLMLFLASSLFYGYRIIQGEALVLPNLYYGKWYYSVWLLSLFGLLKKVSIPKETLNKIVSRMGSNTFVVYMAHLPILLYITERYPLKSVGEAIAMVIALFVGLEMVAELFRRIPVLRKLV